MQNIKSIRHRLIYLIILIIIIILGLLSRKIMGKMTEIIDIKDALWAMMVYFLFRIIFLNWSVLKTGIAALTFSIIIETSQLYHSNWIDNLRNTFLGSVILGSAFVWSDLAAYLAGTILAMLADICIDKRERKTNVETRL